MGVKSHRTGHWERATATTFLHWRRRTGRSQRRLASICEAVHSTVAFHIGASRAQAGAILSRYGAALSKCGDLLFRSTDEALAYLALHHADRYGRVTQALEHLLALGHLPLSKRGIAILDVGAGPGPALYAAADLYADLRAFAEMGEEPICPAPVACADALDVGSGWDSVLHHFSEGLMIAREALSVATPYEFNGPFQRRFIDLAGFSVHGAHHEARARLATQIRREADRYDEAMLEAEAWRQAYSSHVDTPSAYDIIILMNVFTKPEMVTQFDAELRTLGRSLRPGGIVVVIGSAAESYATIQESVAKALTDVRLFKLETCAKPIPRQWRA